MQLFDESGTPVLLGAKLGEGGEGKVFRLANRSSIAAKVYRVSLAPERVDKIQQIKQLQQPLLTQFTSWPFEIIRDQQGRPRGLLGAKDIHNLYTPSSRRVHFPGADWRFLIHVARNVARAFAAVHQLGVVIGDVNPGSILVLRNATVRLIDVDSFQVRGANGKYFLCTVAVPTLLPPELYSAPLSSTVRTTHHDTFGLAVTLFQLLLMGRHPYAGKYLGTGEMPIERAIPEHRFAYAADAEHRAMRRPPNAAGLEILNRELASLFESAFSPEAPTKGRPAAKTWAGALDRLSVSLQRCALNGQHYHTEGLSSCPWCTMERATGAVLFVERQHLQDPNYCNVEYDRLIRHIRAAMIPKPITPSVLSTEKNPASEAVQSARMPAAGWYALGTGVLLLVVALVQLPHVVGIVLLIAGIMVAGFGGNAKRSRQKPWVSDYRTAQIAYKAACDQLAQANEFRKSNGIKAMLGEQVAAWERLPRLRDEKLKRLETEKRQLQMRQYLSSHMVSDVRIKGLGPTRIATLLSYGVSTALDVDEERIVVIPGFGPKRAQSLINWRREVEHRFAFKPSSPLPQDVLSNLEREIYQKRQEILKSLRRVAHELQSAIDLERKEAASVAQRVTQTHAVLAQAAADVRAATGSVPS
jgi:DNA-binding helix-hairpin-helix protein with protein kinase domain